MTKHYITITLLLVLFAAGCGEKLPAGLPPLYPCTLTFTQGGKPLVEATVGFVPVDQTLRFSFSGLTDTNGTFVPLVNGKYKGMPAGTWKCTIAKKDMRGNRQFVWQVSLVDAKYADAAGTPLELLVKKGKNVFTFDVGEPGEWRISDKWKPSYGDPLFDDKGNRVGEYK
ncbi:MAG: hypothetical protein LBT46_06805 [Planctomycetaceae bacterium]|jgi:hypothetical protein|nr:hypothetical protein [Planctomycetaceae bacterium]